MCGVLVEEGSDDQWKRTSRKREDLSSTMVLLEPFKVI